MKPVILTTVVAAVCVLIASSASGSAAQAPQPAPPSPSSPIAAPAPSEIVAAAPADDWVAIAPSDLLIMQLAPDPRGGAGRTGDRRIVIQLMSAPFSQGWVANIRTLAAAHWWDGLSINRVQDNYVAQWGDADGEEPAKARALPAGLRVMAQQAFVQRVPDDESQQAGRFGLIDSYGEAVDFVGSFPVAQRGDYWWPVHCYGMVGVGRNLSPDTGSGAELYTVIGHAPRHLDRNIALVGRVIEGMEHLSSLPRGTEALGFYATPAERTGIVSIRLASELPAAEQPHFQYLSTESASFARYADARANRRDPFFNVPAGGTDICNIPVPVRRVGQAG